MSLSLARRFLSASSSPAFRSVAPAARRWATSAGAKGLQTTLDKKFVLQDEIDTPETFQSRDINIIPRTPDFIETRTAEELIASVKPVAWPEGMTARCDGGGGDEGHPVVFISLKAPVGAPDGTPVGTCGYCGLRFYAEEHDHAH